MSRTMASRTTASIRSVLGGARSPAICSRPFSQTASVRAGEKNSTFSDLYSGASGPTITRNTEERKASLSDLFASLSTPSSSMGSGLAGLTRGLPRGGMAESNKPKFIEPYHIHIYTHKHNTHVTLTRPNHDVIFSYSCGNVGFRKGGRRGFDPSYQLMHHACNRIRELKLHETMHSLEVILKGFGMGRDACTKVLLGVDGIGIRNKIIRVTDATPLKFGGTKGDNPRRV